MVNIGLIITAAGKSTRFGRGRSKIFAEIDGKSVINKTVSCFHNIPDIRNIVITHSAGAENDIKNALYPLETKADICFTKGGTTRQKSVFLGLKKLLPKHTDYVLIHDAARPWVDQTLIQQVITSMKQHQACIPVLPIIDAVKEVDSNGFIQQALDRTNLRRAQTPQGFSFQEIYAAHETAEENGYNAHDDAELFSIFCGPVATVPGNEKNKKITHKEDIRWT
ncbi:MAG: 2-C-methyl-D-erythritol 4-phosphate cytidylyltransferase [Spirochaetia bacterium]